MNFVPRFLHSEPSSAHGFLFAGKVLLRVRERKIQMRKFFAAVTLLLWCTSLLFAQSAVVGNASFQGDVTPGMIAVLYSLGLTLAAGISSSGELTELGGYQIWIRNQPCGLFYAGRPPASLLFAGVPARTGRIAWRAGTFGHRRGC